MNKFCHVYDLEAHNELEKVENKLIEFKKKVQYLDSKWYAILVNASIKAWLNCNFKKAAIPIGDKKTSEVNTCWL